jgi:hypothetical protein
MTKTLTKLPDQDCPHCGKKIDHTLSLEGAIPEPGDVGICWYCGEPLIFDDTLHQRALSPYELDNLARICPAINDLRARIINKNRTVK